MDTARGIRFVILLALISWGMMGVLHFFSWVFTRGMLEMIAGLAVGVLLVTQYQSHIERWLKRQFHDVGRRRHF